MSVNVDDRVARSRNFGFRYVQHAFGLKIGKFQFHFAGAFRRLKLVAVNWTRKSSRSYKQTHTFQPAPSINFVHVFLPELLSGKFSSRISVFFFWPFSISFTFVCQNGIKAPPPHSFTFLPKSDVGWS